MGETMGEHERIEDLSDRIDSILAASRSLPRGDVARVIAELVNNREKALRKIIGALGLGFGCYVPLETITLGTKESHINISGAALAKVSLDMDFSYTDDGVRISLRSL